MDTLFLFQFGCCITVTLLALALVVSRIVNKTNDPRYEKARWFLVVALFNLTVHYFLQMKYGFRAQGDDVGAVVNILFYAPSSMLISFAILTLVCPPGYKRRFGYTCLGLYAAIVAAFISGRIAYGSLHMDHAMYLMGVLYTIILLFCNIDPLRVMNRIRRSLEQDTASDLRSFNAVMRMGTSLLCILSMLTVAIIFSRTMMNILGPLFMVSLFIFVICFASFGAHVQPLQGLLEDVHDDGNDPGRIPDKRMLQIDDLVLGWVTSKAFRDQNTNIESMARSLDIDRSELSRYLNQRHGITFRIWLSRLRLEEAKRLIMQYPQYSNEAIAAECGFASRPYFQNMFKQETGFTPKEWSLRQKN